MPRRLRSFAIRAESSSYQWRGVSDRRIDPRPPLPPPLRLGGDDCMHTIIADACTAIKPLMIKRGVAVLIVLNVRSFRRASSCRVVKSSALARHVRA
eukprot:2058102-Pleurochrysis_carterae.AAC.2